MNLDRFQPPSPEFPVRRVECEFDGDDAAEAEYQTKLQEDIDLLTRFKRFGTNSLPDIGWPFFRFNYGPEILAKERLLRRKDLGRYNVVWEILV